MKACQRCIWSEGLEFNPNQAKYFFKLFDSDFHATRFMDFYSYKLIRRFSELQDVWKRIIAATKGLPVGSEDCKSIGVSQIIRDLGAKLQ